MKGFVLLLCFALLLSTPAFAAQLPPLVDTEALEQAAPPEMAGSQPDGDLDGGLSKLASAVQEKLGTALRQALSSAGKLLCIALLTGLAGVLTEGNKLRYVHLAGILAAALCTLGDMKGFAAQGAETLHTLSDFSKALLPCMAAAGTVAGGAGAAVARYAGTALFLDVLLTLADRLLLPLLYVYLAAATAKAALADSGFPAGLSELLKWICTTLLVALVLLFTAYLAVTGAVAGSADAVAARVAKTAISTALPVVGGILSDAAGTLLAGAGAVKNGIGVFGLLAVCWVCIAPVLRLGAQYLLLKLCAGLCAMAGDARLGKLVAEYGGACGMLLGMVGAGAAMLFVSILMSLQAVSGI